MTKDPRRELRSYRNKVTAAKNKAKRQQAQGIATLCWICKTAIDLELPYHDRFAFTLDHLESLATGGHITGTLLPAHRSCNSSRGKGDKVNPLQGQTRDW